MWDISLLGITSFVMVDRFFGNAGDNRDQKILNSVSVIMITLNYSNKIHWRHQHILWIKLSHWLCGSWRQVILNWQLFAHAMLIKYSQRTVDNRMMSKYIKPDDLLHCPRAPINSLLVFGAWSCNDDARLSSIYACINMIKSTLASNRTQETHHCITCIFVVIATKSISNSHRP